MGKPDRRFRVKGEKIGTLEEKPPYIHERKERGGLTPQRTVVLCEK